MLGQPSTYLQIVHMMSRNFLRGLKVEFPVKIRTLYHVDYSGLKGRRNESGFFQTQSSFCQYFSIDASLTLIVLRAYRADPGACSRYPEHGRGACKKVSSRI